MIYLKVWILHCLLAVELVLQRYRMLLESHVRHTLRDSQYYVMTSSVSPHVRWYRKDA